MMRTQQIPDSEHRVSGSDLERDLRDPVCLPRHSQLCGPPHLGLADWVTPLDLQLPSHPGPIYLVGIGTGLPEAGVPSKDSFPSTLPGFPPSRLSPPPLTCVASFLPSQCLMPAACPPLCCSGHWAGPGVSFQFHRCQGSAPSTHAQV